jgi:hypothetical protein
MLKWLTLAAALSLPAPLAADDPAPAAMPNAQPPTVQSPPVKTGKERLSGKANDEQRVDNCKVPPELHGTTPRPDACDSKLEAIPTN